MSRSGAPLSLKARALQWLAQREHSRIELQRKLLPHAREEEARARMAALASANSHGHSRPVADPARPEPPLGANQSQSLLAAVSQGVQQAGDASGSEPDIASAQDRVEATLEWLQARDFLSQERFVESRVHARSARFGNLRIRQELAQHGVFVSAEAAQALRDSEEARATDVWARRYADGAATNAAAQARQARFLIGRGFSPEVVRRVLRQARSTGPSSQAVWPDDD